MPSAPPDGTGLSLLLHEESVTVTRRQIAGDTVRVETVTRERQQQVETDLTHEHVEIRHVPIGRVIDQMPDVRIEGDITIVPVVEEEVVIQRRLVLREEIHMRRVRVSERHQQTVTVRSQDAIVTRLRPDPGACVAPESSEGNAHD